MPMAFGVFVCMFFIFKNDWFAQRQDDSSDCSSLVFLSPAKLELAHGFNKGKPFAGGCSGWQPLRSLVGALWEPMGQESCCRLETGDS